MKKVVSLVLIVCMMTLFAVPAMAQTTNDLIAPHASLSLSGGMKYNTSIGRYIIYRQCIGIIEQKAVTVALYRKSGTSWIYMDSVSNTDTTPTVRADKYVSIAQSGQYKVTVTGTTSNSNGTVSYTYTI